MKVLFSLLTLCTLLSIVSSAQVSFKIGANTKIVSGIYDAENQLFIQPSNRLLVTGGDNVYEIKYISSNSSYVKIPLMDSPSYWLGMVQVNDTVYLLKSYPGCTENEKELQNSIYAAKVPTDDSAFEFRNIFNISNYMLPNGIGYYNNTLFISDTAYTKTTGHIGAFSISPSDPFTILSQTVFVDHSQATQPNGLKIYEGSLYYTSIGALKRVPIKADGTAGPIVTLFEHLTVLDDMNFLNIPGYNNTILMVCNYLGGSLNFWDLKLNTLLMSTSLGGFSGPSSLQQNTSPYFPSNALLITDKGVVCNKQEPGNFMSYVTIELA